MTSTDMLSRAISATLGACLERKRSSERSNRRWLAECAPRLRDCRRAAAPHSGHEIVHVKNHHSDAPHEFSFSQPTLWVALVWPTCNGWKGNDG
jgi:hypothetical protein